MNPIALLRAVLVGTTFGLLVACGDSRGDSTHRPIAVWSVEADLRIGAVDDPEYTFTRVMSLRVGPDGSIYSLHPEESVVRRWSEDGLPAGSIGRRGEGPGEFTRPLHMGWQRDSLWVMDGVNRFSFFSPDGAFLGSLTARIETGGLAAAERAYAPRPKALLADGSLLGETVGLSPDILEGRLTHLANVRMSAEGTTLDTIALLPVGRSGYLGIVRDRSWVSASQPFGDGVIGMPTHDGSGFLVLERAAAADGKPSEFRVTRLGLAGDTVFSRGYPYEPITLPRVQVDSAVDAAAEGFHRLMGAQTGATLSRWRGWTRDAMYAPPFYTPVREMLPGRDGSIWLALNPSEQESQLAGPRRGRRTAGEPSAAEGTTRHPR